MTMHVSIVASMNEFEEGLRKASIKNIWFYQFASMSIHGNYTETRGISLPVTIIVGRKFSRQQV